MLEYVFIALHVFVMIFLVYEFAGWISFFVEWNEMREITRKRRLERQRRKEAFKIRREQLKAEKEEMEKIIEQYKEKESQKNQHTNPKAKTRRGAHQTCTTHIGL